MGENRTKFPSISVLIPTKDGQDTLPELLAMLTLQTVECNEVLIAYSGSVDGTVQIAKKHGAEVIPVEPLEFDHGGTRTMLSQHARGDILVFFTQDAIPRRKDSIEQLIMPMLEDTAVATCYGRQVPSFDADCFASSLRKFNYPSKPEVRSLKDKDRLGLKTVFTSNSFACYRKSSLERIGYFKNGLIFGEDTIAVGRLLRGGEKIAYVSDAAVYHSHNYRPSDEFKRYFDIGVLHANEKWLLETFGSAEGQGTKYIKHELRMLHREKLLPKLPESLLRILLKYFGYKLGRKYTMLPEHIVPKFSLHHRWWEVA